MGAGGGGRGAEEALIHNAVGCASSHGMSHIIHSPDAVCGPTFWSRVFYLLFQEDKGLTQAFFLFRGGAYVLVLRTRWRFIPLGTESDRPKIAADC